MSLTNQIHTYSVDTDAFYYEDERLIHNKLNALYIERYEYKKLISKKKDVEANKNLIKEINDIIQTHKEELKFLLAKNKGRIRTLHNDYINYKNVISVFESTFTRTVGISTNQLTDEIIVVQAYYLDVLEDIVKLGFYLNGEKYRYFVSSAGQIRTKKSVYIKEQTWEMYKLSLMGGLTFEDINNKGGINTNKFMAYLALSNSATDLWENFDIDKCIVVKDLDMNIKGNVDFIDETTYEIKNNISKDVKITVTDGCGIMLPSVSEKSRMVRLVWTKGLLVSFNFLEFIKENKDKYPNAHIVTDVYGEEHDVIKEEIEIIFTESQFKLWKYYDGWDDFKQKYKKYKCIAGYCNEEPDRIKNSKLNYQMCQTLYDLTDEEIAILTHSTQEKINTVGTNVKKMLEVLGVTNYNKNKNYFQEALGLYPELLQDKYTKDMITQSKMSMWKDAKGGKLFTKGKYTFVIPDLYSFAENLFLKIEQPRGLLKNGEVSCNIYDNKQKISCLRSPHLSIEHPVRNNVVTENTKKWFTTKGIYISSHDLISKIINNDWDGDQCLICCDKTLIQAQERVSKNVVPILYDMKKAEAEELSLVSMFNGLINAYKSGSIGIFSNAITKVWNKINKENFIQSFLAVKYLCMESNFNIDQAKTLYMPKRPRHINKMIKEVVRGKTPHFFIYAKDKSKEQVEIINNSTMNKICKSIKNKRIDFTHDGLKHFDYTMMMKDSNPDSCDEIIKKYVDTIRHKKAYLSYNDRSEMNNHAFMTIIFREELLSLKYNNNYIVDVLVKYLYEKGDKNKAILWNAFGDIIIENIKNNKCCEVCGKRIEITGNVKYCSECKDEIKREKTRERVKKHREKQ